MLQFRTGKFFHPKVSVIAGAEALISMFGMFWGTMLVSSPHSVSVDVTERMLLFRVSLDSMEGVIVSDIFECMGGDNFMD